MHRTVVIDAVGLTPDLIGVHTPNIEHFLRRGKLATVESAIPAVTTTAQATYLTGVPPAEHGIVANGWYFRDECEVKFWRQSNHLVQAPKLWEKARRMEPQFTWANLFWWYNMYSTADYSITPRPMYPADGRKFPDIYTHPPVLRQQTQERLGQFPLFEFWGPNASINSTRWISESALYVDQCHSPTLTLIYLPHLDYCLQRHGPDPKKISTELAELDTVCGELIEHYEKQGARIILLSEYGITHVHTPVHINRLLREHGFIAVREELGRELLDAGASEAFAVSDHQVSHVYVKNRDLAPRVRELLEETEGIGAVLDEEGKRAHGLDHPRSGELVALAAPGAWFTYYYWLDDERAPDFARTVDIHRKPGFDPVELFVDPQIKHPRFKVASILLKKKFGFRYLMDVIPLDASLVGGSHGLPTASREGPLLATNRPDLLEEDRIPATAVHDLILKHLRS